MGLTWSTETDVYNWIKSIINRLKALSTLTIVLDKMTIKRKCCHKTMNSDRLSFMVAWRFLSPVNLIKEQKSRTTCD